MTKRLVLLLMVSLVSGSAYAALMHNSTNLGSTKWPSGWGITGGQYGQFTCTTCHSMKTTNIKRVKSTITPPSGSLPGGAVVFRSVTAYGTDYGGHATSTHICEVCHSKTIYHNYNTNNNTAGTGHNNKKDCIRCHDHNLAFDVRESVGGENCGKCHFDLYDSNTTQYTMHNASAGLKYQHYIDNDTPGYVNTLPNGPSTNVTSRKCTQCHVDHDKFNPAVNAANKRANNLRPYADITPTTGTNNDVTLCVTCHFQVSDKYVTPPTNTLQSMSIPYPGLTFKNATTLHKSSTHGYSVTSKKFKDGSTFEATCNKCHNDSIGINGGPNDGDKTGMNGQRFGGFTTMPPKYKFGNHISTQNNMFSVFGAVSYQGTVSSAAASTLTVSGSPWTPSQFIGFTVVITAGTGVDQRYTITANTSNQLTISGSWGKTPDATSKFNIVSSTYYQSFVSSATANTLTVSGTPWAADQWDGYDVVITGGTGANQRRSISVNTGNQLTLTTNWTTIPDSSSTFDIVQAPVPIESICFSCHSHNNDGYKQNGAGFDWYGQQPMKSSLEGMLDLFTGDKGTTTATGLSSPVTVIDSTKNWATNFWTGYSVKFYNGTLKGKVGTIASNTGNTLTLNARPRIRSAVAAGTKYAIFKPAFHPLDTFGRHESIERINAPAGPIRGGQMLVGTANRPWNMGDNGTETYLSAATATNILRDDQKSWANAIFNNMTVYFPNQTPIQARMVTYSNLSTLKFNGTAITLQPGESYYIGNRHVTCVDCHNSHAAADHPAGTVSSGTATTLVSTGDAISNRWVTDQFKGFLIRLRKPRGTNVGGVTTGEFEQIRFVKAFNPATGTFTVSLPWTSNPASGDTFELNSNTKWTSLGQDGGRAGEGSTGAWGVKVTGFKTPTLGQFQNMSSATFQKIENVADRTGLFGGYSTSSTGELGAGQRNLCMKCHTWYAFENNYPSNLSQINATGSTTKSQPQTDIAADFNPNNVTHHAVFARGRNQPIKANYNNVSATYNSWYNANWPDYSTAVAGDTVTVTNGAAVFAGAAALPSTALPGWYIYIGADTVAGGGTTIAGTATTGFLEITTITDATHFTVRSVNASGQWVYTNNVAATANWFVTAGLGNTFIPPYGPWSILVCTDCHGSTKTDPIGPHASINKWLLKDADVNLRYEWYDGASVTQQNYSSIWLGARNTEGRYLCFNCHRLDVYGTLAQCKSGLSPAKHLQSRNPHGKMWSADGSHIGKDGVSSTSSTTWWPQYCRMCHGGNTIGGIHGSNAARISGDNVPQSMRMLNGACWNNGLKRPLTTSTGGTCYTIGSANTVSNCTEHSSGATYTGQPTYDYNTY